MSDFSTQEVYGSQNPSKRRFRSFGKVRKIAGKGLCFLGRLLRSLSGRLWRWFRSAPSLVILLRRIGTGIGMVLGVCALLLLLWIAYLYITLPDVDDIGALFAAESTVITDRSGVELYRIHADENRTSVTLDDIANTVELATIAIEDERFYARGCFDPRAFLRAALGNVLGGFGSQGGSTITQQFAKNALIGTRAKRVSRKLREYMLSCRLEDRYPKDRILEFYLNRIPYGQNAHGVEQAAQVYFAKSASGLTLAEATVLAALPQLPSYYNPYGKHLRTTLSVEGERRLEAGGILSADDVRDEDFWMGLIGSTFGTGAGTFSLGGRTDQVLQNMLDLGFITGEQRSGALAELQTMTFTRARENIRAPHFVFHVRDVVEALLATRFEPGFLEKGGLHITTTLDWGLQQRAEAIVQEIGELNINLYGASNASLLAVDPLNGDILTYVGNRDYWDIATNGNVDVVRSPRQPGSSFKPFAYAAAFLNGYAPSTVLYDVPTKIGEDEPENFDRKFWGPLTIRRALGASRNVPAAKAFFLGGGEDPIVALADEMGLPSLRIRKAEISAKTGTPYEYGWPLALGAAEVPLYEMVQGYTTFARMGSRIDLRPILRIEDRLGNILYQAPEIVEGREVLDPRVAYLITNVLSDESARPEYWRTQLSIPGYQTATKTGTSNKCLKRDPRGKCTESLPDNNWTLGYTPSLLAGVWVGNASGGALYPNASGIDTASHIWKEYLSAAHRSLRPLKTAFTMPAGITAAQISELSGDLASPCTPTEYIRTDLFLEGQTPTDFDRACVRTDIDKLTGLLASDECPVEARELGSFFQLQSELPERWPLWDKAEQEWAKQIAAGTGSLMARTAIAGIMRGTGSLVELPLPLVPTEKCRLSLTPGRLVKPTLSIVYPKSAGTASAPVFRPTLQFTVGHEVQEIFYRLDGRLVGHGVPGIGLTPQIRVPRKFDTSGVHTLEVTLVDDYYNQVTESSRFTFTQDRSGPSITIESPLEGTELTIGEEVTVRIAADDPEGAIDRVQFFLGSTLMTTQRTAPFSATFTIGGGEGPTTIRAVAWDSARNQTEDVIGVTLFR